jgi:signal transduction histidine kinase
MHDLPDPLFGTKDHSGPQIVRSKILPSAKFALEPLYLDDVVDEAAGARAGELEKAGVRVLTGELPPVRGDRGQLVKLFGVLLDNAIRHGEARPLTVTVDADVGPALATVTVANDGKPIEAELRPRLFSLLPLGDNGAGGGDVPAGLAVARRIVEGHGGVIWCGPPEAGASISFTLPTVRP